MRIGKVTAPLPSLDWLPLLASLILVISLFAAWPANVKALAFPGQTAPPQPPSTQSEFESYLQAIGRPVVSRIHGYLASFATFASDQLLVYGTPQLVPNNLYDVRYREYQYLGFSYDETPVTNSEFPDTSATGETYSTPWQWQELPLGLLAEISWARLSPRQQELIRSSELYYRRRTYGGMTFAQLSLNPGTTQILAQPSWHLGFVLYTRHYLPGTSQVRYATLTGPGSGDVVLFADLTWEMDLTDNGQVYFEADDEEVIVRYRLSGGVAGLSGLARASDIAYLGVCSEDGAGSHPGGDPISIKLERSIDRAFLEDDESRTLEISGQVWAVSQMGDIRTSELTRSITINREQLELLTAQLTLNGSLNYFRNRAGGDRITPRNENRYLGLEHLTVTAEFSEPPDKAKFTGFGQMIDLETDGEQKTFEWEMSVPVDQQTLTWQDERIQDSLELVLTGQKEAPTGDVSASATIYPVEITGDIHDLYRVLSR